MAETELLSNRTALQEDLEEKEQLQEALAYNRDIRRQQQTGYAGYYGDLADDGDTVYHALLAEDESGVMAVVSVPTLDILLPVMHGTHPEELQTAAGHMYGTSLPVGGPGCNACIAAHTGLPNASLFTELVHIQQGDRVYIYVLGEKHCYRVEEVLTVPQGEEAPWLMADEADRVTLYTCTPPGINDHRLLVRCTRDLLSEEAGEEGTSGTQDTGEEVLHRQSGEAQARAVSLLVLVLIIPAFFLFVFK
jgi:sortase A